MVQVMRRSADRLLGLFVPKLTADAVCYCGWGTCCGWNSRRWVCDGTHACPAPVCKFSSVCRPG